MSKKTTKSAQAQARSSTGQFIKEIRRNTAKVYTSEQKIQIVLEGMRAELSLAELCCKYGSLSLRITNGTRSLWKPARSVLPGNGTEYPISSVSLL